MANGQGTLVPPGGSVSQTAAVALPVTGSAVVLNWLVAPVWPPPSDVLLVAIGVASPILHMLGRAIYHKLAVWTGESDNGNHDNVNGGASTAPAATASPSATAVATPSTPPVTTVPLAPVPTPPPTSPLAAGSTAPPTANPS